MTNRILILLCLLSGLLIPEMQGQTSSQNYIRTRAMTNESGTNFVEQVNYYDGLGRLRETVQAKTGNALQDGVTLIDYDDYGRTDKVWLPVPVNGNNSNYISPATIRSDAPGFHANDSKPYSQTVYEASPQNRAVKEFDPGNNWYANDRANHTAYLTNTTSYPCALYSSSNSRTTISITRSGNYTGNTLFVIKYQDEDNNVWYEFKDKQERLLLSREVNGSTNFDTYYIYDDYDNLKVVLSPLASDVLTSNTTWSESNATLQKYAYLYKYDDRNRCIAKKLPGADWTYYVYDDADHLIFSQNGEQRSRSEWSFSIPDKLGRTAISGICNNSLSYTGNSLNGKVLNAVWPSGGAGTYKGYNLEGGVALTNTTILSVNYYDTYEFIGKNGVPSGLVFEFHTGYATSNLSTPKGLLTGQITSELGNSSAQYYSVNYYDSKSQIILTTSTNHLNGTDKEFVVYSFDGLIDKRYHIHTAYNNTVTGEYVYSYDNMRRLTSTTHSLNGATPQIILEKSADNLGRSYFQRLGRIDILYTYYNYDVRDRIIDYDCLVKELLTYSYGGNILNQTVKLGIGNRIYDYAYDGLSRLTNAAYTFEESEYSPGPNDFSSSYSYDKNGNVSTIQRTGRKSASGYGTVDNMTYVYDGNQVKSISDAAGNVPYSYSHDFKDYSNQATEYTYNLNGSITKDLNRGISDVQYNDLNLPSRIDIKSPVGESRSDYTYSSSGEKLRIVHKWNPAYSSTPVIGSGVTPSSLTSSETTDYVGDYVYVNNALKYILTEVGYIEGGVYHYYTTDHLGSNRFVTVPSGSNGGANPHVNNYYPFGLSFGDQQTPDYQSYKFTGKELDMKQGLNWYDFHARFYDPATCRFMTMDPKAEMYYSISPYAYCGNNPVNYVDPSGMSMDWVQDKLKRVYWDPNAKSQASTKAGETYLGQTVNAMDQEGNFGYGDQYGKWWNSAPLGETAVNGIRAIGSDHISAAMRNSARGYDDQWMNGFNQFVGVGISAINLALNATSIAKELADFAGGMRVVTSASTPAKGIVNFTKSGFRQNLIKSTGINPGKASQAHHVFPQQYKTTFNQKGINIHDPKFGVWWETSDHLKNAYGYNQSWRKFLRSNPSQFQIMDFGRQIMNEHDITVGF